MIKVRLTHVVQLHRRVQKVRRTPSLRPRTRSLRHSWWKFSARLIRKSPRNCKPWLARALEEEAAGVAAEATMAVVAAEATCREAVVDTDVAVVVEGEDTVVVADEEEVEGEEDSKIPRTSAVLDPCHLHHIERLVSQ